MGEWSGVCIKFDVDDDGGGGTGMIGCDCDNVDDVGGGGGGNVNKLDPFGVDRFPMSVGVDWAPPINCWLMLLADGSVPPGLPSLK